MGELRGREDFFRKVILPIRIAYEGRQLAWSGYLQLPKAKRANDEAAVVDELFTPRLLQWLGYSDADWIYNRTGAERDRPDYRVAPNGSVAFVVEDKNTTEELDAAHLKQMRRYTAGTGGYALWTNARRIVGVRFHAKGSYDLLVQISLDSDQEGDESFALLHQLFRRQRYVDLSEILDRIAVSEDKWQRSAISSQGAREEFINSAKNILTEIATAARAQIEQAEIDHRDSLRETRTLSRELQRRTRKFVADLGKISDTDRKALLETLLDLLQDPATVEAADIDGARPERLAKADAKRWEQWAEDIRARVVALRDGELPRNRLRRIATAFEVWKERYRIIEDEEADERTRRHAYSEQVAYTFFIRLLLARILEDRGILPRLLSNGGLRDWREFLRSHFNTEIRPHDRAELMPEALLALLYRSVSRYYRHFFSQPVFDWFEPDDYLLALALDKLSQYDFAEIEEDILGYTYEAYIDEVARARKGHFLTPGRVVDLMLQQSGYEGVNIIGKRVIDTAVGSGSFLVHAARRLRRAIATSEALSEGDESAKRERIAIAFIQNVQRDLVGLEINPFSCYLSELNLFIQVLDDLVFLWGERGNLVEVDRFQIYNTNSLQLPRRILFQHEQLEPEFKLDEAWDVKETGEGTFDFVVGNPPYINRGVIAEAPSYKDIPFYADVLSGDQNTYILFLRIAAHYCAPGGTISQIVPINLLGDSSAEEMRKVLAGGEFSLASITRFYRREVLFDGVLQRVCIVTAARSKVNTQVRVSGGKDVEEAEPWQATVGLSSVVNATPEHVSTRWAKSWLVQPEEVHYEIWKHFRGTTSTDIEQWTKGRLKFQQGDVNKTRTKVFRTEEATDATIPITCAERIDNFGPWERDVWIDPEINPKKRGLKERALADALREREERILRVASLTHPEWVLGLKDTVGMEAIRPLRGGLWKRSGKEPFLLDHTLQVAYPIGAQHNVLVQAAFGLLVSAIPSYVLQLFSTNAHATRDEILRTPVPNISEALVKALASAALATQQAGEQFYDLLHGWGGTLRLATIELDPDQVLQRSHLPSVTIADACRRGLLPVPQHPDWKVSRLVARGELAAEGPPAFQEAVRLLLEGHDETFTAAAKVRVPDPAAASRFLDSLKKARSECEDAYGALMDERAGLDQLVFSVYEIRRESWQRAILHGVPWAVEGQEELEMLEGRVIAAPRTRAAVRAQKQRAKDGKASDRKTRK